MNISFLMEVVITLKTSFVAVELDPSWFCRGWVR